ncbi:glycosyltransferase family 61 protein [Nocardioides sp. AX2bis]|uniref:glycosyltransferase family 61 protein n=1 Tax=Nocardioides sp. AX2bis TaxID=2653157 RepID=UPI0012EEFE3F|nr:glycosyltransferase 61 family protein [Nocardioides sp. AX2bis]VXC14200.1 conserved hypothetical protein [Nocardioides sp. AX2bis]
MSTSGAPSPWVAAVSPDAPPAEEPTLVRVEDALLTGFESGPLNASKGPRRWIRGAVHDRDGALVPSSQRHWAGDVWSPVAADPERVKVPSRGRRLEGTWLYVGHWPQHFGHFVLETLTNLWPDPEQIQVDGLLGHRRFRGEAHGHRRPAQDVELVPWKLDLLELAGYAGRRHVQVNTAPAHVETLLVPQQPVVLKSWATPAAVALWERVAGRTQPGTDARVFLSRRRWHEAREGRSSRVRTSPEWEDHVEQAFRDQGFRIVHPETLPVVEQIGLVSGADVVAGFSGSALHLSAFAGPETRVVEIGDLRSATAPMATQQMVDAARGHRVAFCEHADRAALRRVLEAL